MRELLAVAAALPCLLVVRYLASRLGPRSARRALWVTFGLGALSTVVVLAFASQFARPVGAPMPDLARDLGNAFLLAAVPEETMKFLVVVGFAVMRGHLRDERSGVAHGLAASLGFASVEMVLFTRDGGLEAAAVRTVTTAPCHAFLGTVMGYLVGRAVGPRRVALGRMAPGLAVPLVVHGAYDLPLMSLSHARAGTAASGPWEHIGLAMVGATVLVVGCVVGHRIFRGAFPRPGPALRAAPARRAAARGPATHGFAWSLIPLGGAIASAGAWIVGSLLFVEIPGLEAVPNAAQAITLLYVLGLSLLCFGLAYGFRGIRMRHSAPGVA